MRDIKRHHFDERVAGAAHGVEVLQALNEGVYWTVFVSLRRSCFVVEWCVDVCRGLIGVSWVIASACVSSCRS